MSEKIYPEGQYVAGESMEVGDYILKAEQDYAGDVEMYADYDHFVAGDSFLYKSFNGQYRLALRKEGVVVVICDAVGTRIQPESEGE